MLHFANDKEISITNLLSEKKYPVDFNYQREPGAWTREDEQFFIDSLLKRIRIPKIYLHKKRNRLYIVDGQQRIETIRKFVKGDLRLSSNITEHRKDNLTFNDLSKRERERFLGYKITSSIIVNTQDRYVRDLFRRLQRGKPLTVGEKLNALPGKIVNLMRSLTNHDFFKISLSSPDKRHKFYHLAAIFLYVEDAVRDTKPTNLFNFFRKNQNMKRNDKIFTRSRQNLNYLAKCYRENELPVSNIGWLVSVYLFISELRDSHAIAGRHEEVHTYLENFWSQYNNKPRGDYKKFHDWVSKSTNSKSNIRNRTDILKNLFVKGYEIHIKDERRIFNKRLRKIVYTNARRKCQYKHCSEDSKEIPFNNIFEIHHKKMHALGGKTEPNHGMLVHKRCHNDIHRTMRITTKKNK